MSKIFIGIFALAISYSAYAETWEYKVVFLPGSASGAKITKEESGAYFDETKTKILNTLGKSGWELISVTGDSGADHALYMKRKVK